MRDERSRAWSLRCTGEPPNAGTEATDLEDVIGGEAATVTDRLARARGTRAKLRLLAHWLAQRMGRGRAMDRAIAWAVGTLDGGYYDQSHMNGELKQLAGISPRQFLAARHPVGDGTTAAG